MKLAIAGGLGRMGKTLIEAIAAAPQMQLAAVSVKDASEIPLAKALLAQVKAGAVEVVRTTGELVAAADAVIDFTAPEYSLAMAEAVAAQQKIHIVGTTGFNVAQLAQLGTFGQRARIVQSGNFSIGVNVVARLVEQAAMLLSEEYDIEIVEMHHRHKKDAPSGTALLLAEAAAEGRQKELKKLRRHYGEGQIGEREKGTIGIVARRGGEIVGDHTVTFAGDHEVIELSHRSFSRAIYAQGAIRAALWAKDQPPGFYSMRNVLA